tara:strand:+ start:842 stop:1090 length:249 start_codon:yes stop_codon:yes gene_type:complete
MEENIMDNTLTIKNVVLVLLSGQMVENTSVNGTMESSTVKASISIEMVKKEEAHGTRENVSIGLIQVLESKLNKNQRTKNDY